MYLKGRRRFSVGCKSFTILSELFHSNIEKERKENLFWDMEWNLNYIMNVFLNRSVSNIDHSIQYGRGPLVQPINISSDDNN